MLKDLAAKDVPGDLQADVCIIGGGPAGITAALALQNKFQKVCLLEAGGLELEDETQALYDGEDVGVPSSLIGGRLRMLGGSSNHWGGRCGRMEASDFERRPSMPLSGWPFDRSALDPFYERAWTACGFKQPFPSAARIATQLEANHFALRSESLRPFVWQYAWQAVNTGWSFSTNNIAALRSSSVIDLVLHANVSRINLSADRGRVVSVDAISLTGPTVRVTAKYFVLACGGIENARLLLVGDGDRAIGNDFDTVGRFYMQHPRAQIGTIERPSVSIAKSLNFDVFDDKLVTKAPVQVGLALTTETQRLEGISGCDATFRLVRDEPEGLTAARTIEAGLKAGYWPAQSGSLYLKLMKDLGALTEMAVPSDHEKFGSIAVEADLEQQPNPESRITLGSERDRLGMRRVVADWRIGDDVYATAAAFMKHLGIAVQKTNGGRVRAEPWVLDRGKQDGFTATFHYIGTTRISEDPRHGVVDADCRVHGCANLFVAGSSVFPTSSHVNPTLTLLALTLRLSDHLATLNT